MDKFRGRGCLISVIAVILIPIIISMIVGIVSWLRESINNPFNYARIVEMD